MVECDREGRGVTTEGRRGEVFQVMQRIPMLVFVVIMHIYPWIKIHRIVHHQKNHMII